MTQQLHSSRARMSRQSATLATTTRSTQMLRLTTCTPGIRWLHHCTFMSEKQVRACCRFITHKGKACFNVHSHFWACTGKPVTGCHKKRKSNQELDNCQIRIIWGRTREQLLAEAKSEILRHEYRAHLAEKIFVNCLWIEETNWFSSSGNWKQGMKSPDESKLCFTKIWQIENEHFVILVLEVFKSWKNWRDSWNFDSKNFFDKKGGRY